MYSIDINEQFNLLDSIIMESSHIPLDPEAPGLQSLSVGSYEKNQQEIEQVFSASKALILELCNNKGVETLRIDTLLQNMGVCLDMPMFEMYPYIVPQVTACSFAYFAYIQAYYQTSRLQPITSLLPTPEGHDQIVFHKLASSMCIILWYSNLELTSEVKHSIVQYLNALRNSQHKESSEGNL